VRYELLLQSPAPGAPFEPARVDEVLRGRAVEERPDGARLWRLKAGEVEVRRLVEGGAELACVLRVPLSDKLDLVRELVVEGSTVAQEAGARLYDPQLSRTLNASDEGLVADQFLRTARYAGEMMGLPEAVGASFAVPDEGLKPGTKVLLGLLAVGALLWVLMEAFLLR
jgi:hypothetical protein